MASAGTLFSVFVHAYTMRNNGPSLKAEGFLIRWGRLKILCSRVTEEAKLKPFARNSFAKTKFLFRLFSDSRAINIQVIRVHHLT